MVYPDISYGQKYNKEMQITDIAKKIREFVKEKNYKNLGTISITAQRFSGGRSLDVRITPNKNPYRFEPINGSTHGNANPYMQVYLIPEYSLMLKEIQAEIDAYNYDGSDMMTDYSHVNFYGNVQLEDVGDMMKEAPQMDKNDKSSFELEQEGFKECRRLYWVDDYGYKEMLARVVK